MLVRPPPRSNGAAWQERRRSARRLHGRSATPQWHPHLVRWTLSRSLPRVDCWSAWGFEGGCRRLDGFSRCVFIQDRALVALCAGDRLVAVRAYLRTTRCDCSVGVVVEHPVVLDLDRTAVVA